MRIPFSARLCTSSATRGIVTPVNGESPTGAEETDGEEVPGRGVGRDSARRGDGVVGRGRHRDVQFRDRAPEIDVQDRPGRGVVAAAHVPSEVARDPARAVAAFLEDLVHEGELPRLRGGENHRACVCVWRARAYDGNGNY
eukprot:17590-Pelagococcus_subviridis.AAC.2